MLNDYFNHIGFIVQTTPWAFGFGERIIWQINRTLPAYRPLMHTDGNFGLHLGRLYRHFTWSHRRWGFHPHRTGIGVPLPYRTCNGYFLFPVYRGDDQSL